MTRSADPLLALSYWFEAARRRAGLDTLVLSDTGGLAIAGAGNAASCDEIAARAAVLVALRPANDTVPCRLDVVARTFEVRRLRIDGVEVLLCSEGSEGTAGEASAALSEAAAGCERILGRRRGSPPAR
jgi:hypothetical protein